jgi:hypothetical protein
MTTGEIVAIVMAIAVGMIGGAAIGDLMQLQPQLIVIVITGAP